MDFSAFIGHEDMLTPGSPDIAQLRADAVPLLTQLDQREGLQTKTVIPLKAGMWNALFLMEPAGIVAKLSVGDNDFEVNFLRQAHALEIPVPQVFSAGTLDHPTLQIVTYFLMSYIANSVNAWPLAHSEEGLPLDILHQLGNDIGQSLAKLHQVHLGYITRLGTKVETWQQAITDSFSPDWDNPAPNKLFDEKLLPILNRILQKTGYLSFQDGTLMHCDLNLSNVLLDANSHRLRAVIDPAGFAGMPMFDLAYAAMPWDTGFEFYEAMLSSYRQHSALFNADLFYTSILVVAYRHDRFHTQEVRDSIYKSILSNINF